ncbi:unnamed protein product [Chrysodeixis includens]|uniref:DUF4776 domain-containing protein n=1 Tax=Chrysodeixis includens TaxID=689277 RepID=A0A9P0FZI0_CHRIL|nr:unnamed protein product [Chrysodeixis includens]
MATTNAMFIFEVVVENVKSMVESRLLVIKSDFANIFSLELKDPKQTHIVMPEPLPLPPEPPGKKGKKAKKKPKPKGKKGKKGKGVVEAPPPEPAIQSGQSVLFACSAEVLLESMKNSPLELSLWSKEENLIFIGTTRIPWDPIFILYLEKIVNCQEPPPVTLKDEYNIFEEGRARLMAKLSMQVKLSYLSDKITTAFRTLSEDPAVKKCLYTGFNTRETSYMCTLKTSEEMYIENANKIESQFIVDKPKPTNVVFADYKNAPSANLAFFDEKDYCCLGHADKPPESKYKTPETCPDIDFIIDYVRKIIVSCNDNMRMLTPRPTISPRFKATDVDRLCYCRETSWPEGTFAERFRHEAQRQPCPICIDAGKKPEGVLGRTFDIANIRGPCGTHDCRIARDLRAYIERLVVEDNVEFNVDDLIGPCGSKDCTLTRKIKEFLRHEGPFAHGTTQEGLSTQCACVEKMQQALVKRASCASVCTKNCEDSDSDTSVCSGKGCPYRSPDRKVYDVYYFTVEYDFNKDPPKSGSDNEGRGSDKEAPGSDKEGRESGKATPASGKESRVSGQESAPSGKGSHVSGQESAASGKGSQVSGQRSPASGKGSHVSGQDTATSGKSSHVSGQVSAVSGKGSHVSGTDTEIKSSVSSRVMHCSVNCPSRKAMEKVECSKTACPTQLNKDENEQKLCVSPVCPSKYDYSPSPPDSAIEMQLDEITNLCCVKSCDVAEKVKDIILDGITKKSKCNLEEKDSCYCDCVCTFKFTKKTTYCAVCGGYECLGDDMIDQPEFIKPHPCPVYHKLYDKTFIRVQSPWPDDEEKQKPKESGKGSKAGSKAGEKTMDRRNTSTKLKAPPEKPEVVEKHKKHHKREKKKIGKFTANVAAEPTAQAPVEKKPETKYPYPPVPKTMGWNWLAEDVPGMKPRPKWKPGAVNKLLVRKYRQTREGLDSMNKKKRALLQRKKKIEMKPTLVVSKQGGEYTVQMEVFKKYSKERLLFQYPYDEKPPIIYTIGKTEEERRKIQRQRDRRERRETRRKSRLLQSTFRDRCQEICLKAYNQAIGLLPLPNVNDPDCPCNTKPDPSIEPPIVDSCSCSDVGTISTSDTDNDDWIIEFTPPAARWDAKAKHPPVLAENDCQYNYLDYKVKLFDKSGNPVPRYFKGPDGKQECSDLGGFWSPTHTWLEINKDGYIGPDDRWVPMNFTGPDGMFYSAEEGSFTDNAGQLLKIGVDGYIDKDGKWAWYSKKKGARSLVSKSTATASTIDAKHGANAPRDTSHKGKTTDAGGKVEVVHDKLKEKKKPPPSVGVTPTVSVKTPKTTDKPKKNISYATEKGKNPVVMSVSVNYDKRKLPRFSQMEERHKLRLDAKKLAKYREIIEELKAFDDLGELKPPPKANRASNTPRKKLSPFTMQENSGTGNSDRKKSLAAVRSLGFRTSTTSSRNCS